jgi:two-component sensor histidine kinase
MLGVMVLLSVVLGISQFKASRSAAQIEAHRAAHVVATQFSWVFQVSALALREIEETVASPVDADGQVIGTVQDAVRDLPAGYESSVYDAAGALLYSSEAAAATKPVSDLPYFTRLRDGEELVISPQTTDRAMGTGVFIVARRLDRDGQFAGIATIAIPQRTLAALATVLSLAEGSTLALIADDGMLISREPSVAAMNLVGTPLFDQLKDRPNGTYDNVSPADGTRRIVGYWKLEDWPVIAVTGISKTGAYSEVLRQWSIALIFLSPAIIFMGLLFYRLTQLLRVDEDRQRQLVAAMDRSNFLLREIHHRVKNNLQTVMSLIRLETIPPDAKQRLASRIEAMVKVHEEMYHSDQFEHVQLRPYLTRLIEGIAQSHGVDVALTLQIAPVEISGDRAMQLGLLTNELVSNAYKHAFVGRRSGRLEVRLSEPSPGRLELVVTDDGPGYLRDLNVQNMGSRLVEAFASQLGGSVLIETDGRVRVAVDFPREFVA